MPLQDQWRFRYLRPEWLGLTSWDGISEEGLRYLARYDNMAGRGVFRSRFNRDRILRDVKGMSSQSSAPEVLPPSGQTPSGYGIPEGGIPSDNLYGPGPDPGPGPGPDWTWDPVERKWTRKTATPKNPDQPDRPSAELTPEQQRLLQEDQERQQREQWARENAGPRDTGAKYPGTGALDPKSTPLDPNTPGAGDTGLPSASVGPRGAEYWTVEKAGPYKGLIVRFVWDWKLQGYVGLGPVRPEDMRRDGIMVAGGIWETVQAEMKAANKVWREAPGPDGKKAYRVDDYVTYGSEQQPTPVGPTVPTPQPYVPPNRGFVPGPGNAATAAAALESQRIAMQRPQVPTGGGYETSYASQSTPPPLGANQTPWSWDGANRRWRRRVATPSPSTPSTTPAIPYTPAGPAKVNAQSYVM
jgi:hypothetical protein